MPIILLVEDSEVDRQLMASLLDRDFDWLISHAKNGVEAVKMLRGGAKTWVLRVADGDALATANAYHGLAEVEYSHPDFVRVMPPRPADLRTQDQRIVLAPDGSLLPPDTVIETGRTDLRVIEPATEILPARHATKGSEPSADKVTRVGVKNEDFEGAFPNDWTRYGSPTWAPETYRAYAGSESGYCL